MPCFMHVLPEQTVGRTGVSAEEHRADPAGSRIGASLPFQISGQHAPMIFVAHRMIGCPQAKARTAAMCRSNPCRYCCAVQLLAVWGDEREIRGGHTAKTGKSGLFVGQGSCQPRLEEVVQVDDFTDGRVNLHDFSHEMFRSYSQDSQERARYYRCAVVPMPVLLLAGTHKRPAGSQPDRPLFFSCFCRRAICFIVYLVDGRLAGLCPWLAHVCDQRCLHRPADRARAGSSRNRWPR